LARTENASRLATLADMLGAKRNPYYVRHPIPPTLRREFPSEGWYWIPAGEDQARFLARDVFDAYHVLMLRLEAETAELEEATT
jgi:hypothetical protein